MNFSINNLIWLFILVLVSSCGGGGGGSSGPATVNPTISSFSATSTTIVTGSSVDLTAEFAEGTGVIDNGVGAVSSSTAVSVSPSQTTTYTLTVTKSDGTTDNSSVTVTVVALNSLNILNENLDQIFQSNQSDYTATVGYLAKSIKIKATSADAGASITVDAVATDADNLSQSIVLAEGADTVIDIVVTQNAVSKNYTLTVSRELSSTFAEQAYIKASNTGAGDEFGYSVALSGDTLAVGAYLEDSSTTGVDSTADELATDSGAVYVFVRSGSTWTQQAYIKASNTEAGDQFGYSVALSGDTLAVGANREDSSSTGISSTPDELATWAGAVYVFTRSGTTWSEQAYIKASNADANDGFGISVSLSGDTLAVGAIGEDSSTTGVGSTPDDLAANAGAVYVFARSGITWSEQAYIKASNTSSGDEFGISASLSGNSLAVGAHYEDSSTSGVNSTPDESATWAGAAYVFVRSGTIWTEQAYIKASNTDGGDEFGISVSLSGDTLAVGAYQEDSSTTGVGTTPDEFAKTSGAAYVFVRNDTTWSEQAYIKASNTQKADLFGYNVALSGDTLAVGAYGEDSSSVGIGSIPDELASRSGAVYTFTRNGVNWSEHAYIKASNTGSSDEFGRSLALSGDTLAVGAHFEDSSTMGINSISDDLASNAGAVYTFE